MSIQREAHTPLTAVGVGTAEEEPGSDGISWILGITAESRGDEELPPHS